MSSINCDFFSIYIYIYIPPVCNYHAAGIGASGSFSSFTDREEILKRNRDRRINRTGPHHVTSSRGMGLAESVSVGQHKNGRGTGSRFTFKIKRKTKF